KAFAGLWLARKAALALDRSFYSSWGANDVGFWQQGGCWRDLRPRANGTNPGFRQHWGSDDRISRLPSPGFSYSIQSLYIWIPSLRRRFRFRWKKRCAAVTLITP